MNGNPLIAVRLDEHPADVDLALTRAAVWRAGEIVRQEWVRLAGVAVGRASGEYVDALGAQQAVVYPYDGDALAIGIVNDAPHAGLIEWGFEAFNLASKIKWGQTPGAKKNKRGGWYINIPFRHYTPGGKTPAARRGAMPSSVYQVAKHLQPGQRLTTDAARILAGQHQDVRAEYARGMAGGVGRLVAVQSVKEQEVRWQALGMTSTVTRPGTQLAPASARTRALMGKSKPKSAASLIGGLEIARKGGGPVPDPNRKSASIFEGMFKNGAPGHTQYMTIRTITPQSSWVIPSRPGAHLAEQAARATDLPVRIILEDAFRTDVELHLLKSLTGG